jgi:calcium-translocating P-type ATPase
MSKHKILASLESSDDRDWEVTAQELSDLVKNRDTGESVPQIQSKYGGVSGLAKKLRSDAKKGLGVEETTDHLSERQRLFGENRLPEKEATGFFEYLFDALKDETLIVLMIAAVISIILECTLEDPKEGWIEGTAILVTVFVVATVTAGNDVVKDKQFRALSAVSADRKIKVERGGQIDQISVFDVVIGDIVVFDTGDYIPADMILISGQSLHVDESAMTGEAETVQKNESDPFLLSGTMVTEGVGRGLVIAVGPHSQWGKIKESLDKEDEKTPLQEQLENLAELIGKIGLAAAIITFFALLFRWIIVEFAVDHAKWDWDNISDIVSFLIIGIIVLVIAVPEGLPLAVTLSLAYSMMKMMKDQNLVRHLVACETMGSATCICSDKTGTLTQNKMTVVKLWMGQQVFEDIASSSSAVNTAKSMERVTELLCTGVCVNSSAYIEKRESGKIEFVGAKTEGAMLVLADKLGFQYDIVRDTSKIVRLFPFSSAKKRMSTLVEASQGGRLHVKGASEVILDLCTGVLDQKGEVQPMNQDKKKQLGELINNWASQGLRTLSIACRDISQDKTDHVAKNPDFKEDLDKDLTLIGIVGIEDPVREEVPDAIAQCKRAGITVRMVTGDNILTAKKIGRQCGILTDDGVAIEGPDFRKLSAEEIDKLIPKLQIIARCSPHDKLILVKHLRERGEVVGVTGDGTNDAPILREADVGFAMGISGTEVAKSAADVIILDDNFASIEKAVLWGRNVYDSIRKFIQFQSTINAVALVTAFVGALSKGYSPLTAVQLLWVNLIMDTLAALALATETPNEGLLDRRPHGRDSKLITRLMWRTIIGGAILQLIILFAILYSEPLIDRLADDDQDEKDLRKTLIFNVFVLMQVFNEINCRKLENERNVFKNFFNNPLFLSIIGITTLVQVILVQFAGPFASTIGLTWKQWVFCFGISFVVLPWGILVRFIPIPQEKEEQHNNQEEKSLLPKHAKAKHYSAVDQL